MVTTKRARHKADLCPSRQFYRLAWNFAQHYSVKQLATPVEVFGHADSFGIVGTSNSK